MLRYGHMVQESLVARLRTLQEERRMRLALVRTRAQAEAYVKEVRRAARGCFTPFPKRTPLQAKVSHVIPCGNYIIETVHFQSRPGVFVTGNLYRPATLSGKAPCVLGLCGHSAEGKAESAYQAFSQALVAQGFIVFIIDPISQGERRQFYPQDGGARPPLCHAHNLMGNQMRLLGDFFGSWRVWDATRALDYLLSRPEVDTTRVGVTGNSGGGTLTTYLTALDPRITMAAPSCHVGSYVTDLENELPRDAEQNPPGLLARGLDTADLLLCHAPRPTLILSQQYDFFDERAAKQAYEEVRHIYRRLGAASSVGYFVGSSNHGYHPDARTAMVRFFCKHAGVRYRKPSASEIVRAPEDLFAAPRGEVRALGNTPVFAITQQHAKEAASTRPALRGKALERRVRALLSLPNVQTPPDYRILSQSAAFANDWQRHQFAVETEPGVHAILSQWSGHNRLPTGTVTVCLGHLDVLDEIKTVPALRALAQKSGSFLTLDPRGMGETRALTCGNVDFFLPYGSDFLYASTHDMLGEPYLGRRVFDVLRTLDCLVRYGATRIHLIGRGLGAITAAFAGFLHPAARHVHLLHYLPAYELLAATPQYAWPLSYMLPDVLNYFDLPDLYKAMGRRLTLAAPWNAQMKPLRQKGKRS